VPFAAKSSRLFTGRHLAGAVILWLLLAGGCSRRLSRDRAAAMISKHPDFQAPITTDVIVGELWLDWRDFADNWGKFAKWRNNGLITVKPTDQIEAVWYRLYVIELAPAAAAAAKNWQRVELSTHDAWENHGVRSWPWRPSKPILYRVPLAVRKLEAVLGLQPRAGETAYLAHFRYRLDASPNAAFFPDVLPSPLSGREGLALFRLWDDGWRLEELHLK
jgi:hypothetical protein